MKYAERPLNDSTACGYCKAPPLPPPSTACQRALDELCRNATSGRRGWLVESFAPNPVCFLYRITKQIYRVVHM